jgi:hypothetical protein
MAWLYCPPESLDASTGTCSRPVWVDQMPGGLPPLSGAQGAQIAWAVVGVWTLGLIGRFIIKAIRNRNS